ncbi:MAG: hypothetical protein WDW36_010126 [Sanguina aurantia]
MFSYTSVVDRWLARSALVVLILGGSWGIVSIGQPVYWRYYATVLRPFEDPTLNTTDATDDPFSVTKIHTPEAGAVLPAAAPVSEQARVELLQQDSAAIAAEALAQKAKVSAAAAAVKEEQDRAAAALRVKHAAAADLRDKEAVEAAAKALATPVVVQQQPFDVNDYLLTKERVHGLLERGVIMVTWANHHYLDFARSWVAQVKKSGINGYLVGAMDDDMLRDLVTHNVHTWRMNTGMTKGDLGWGSKNFHEMGRFKIKLIKQFLDLDATLTVVISDIDTAWVQNPMPYFDRYPTADILTSTDELRPTVMDDSLEKFPQAGSSFNIGIMLFRNTSKAFVEDWIKALDDPQMWDQNAFNNLARKGHLHSEAPLNLWRGYDQKLTFGVLPCALFASGHVFFVQHKAEELGLQPYVAHATFQYSGTPGKRHRFREALLWEDPPEYFDHHKGFITYTNTIPEALLLKAAEPLSGEVTRDMLDSHFALVNHQLLSVRAAMAVATLTGRVLIMPAIACQLDKYWGPLSGGNIPGSQFKKPFICPMDHVFDLEGGWNPKRHEPDFGPHIEWRESSFLRNPRLSAAVSGSRVLVVPCRAGDAGCGPGTGPAASKDGKTLLQLGLNSGALAGALAGLAGIKILDFGEHMASAFGAFDLAEENARYERRLNHATSVMCCLQTQPGWIWYDLFWDQPHKDRFGRAHVTFGRPYIRGDSQGVTLRRRDLLALPHTSSNTSSALQATMHVDDADDVNDGDVMGRDTFTMSGRRGGDSGDGLNGLLPDRDVSALWLLEPREDSSAYSGERLGSSTTSSTTSSNGRLGSSSSGGVGGVGGNGDGSSATESSNDTDSSDLTLGSSESNSSSSSSSDDGDVEMGSSGEVGVVRVGTIRSSEDLSKGESQRHGKHVETLM